MRSFILYYEVFLEGKAHSKHVKHGAGVGRKRGLPLKRLLKGGLGSFSPPQ